MNLNGIYRVERDGRVFSIRRDKYLRLMRMNTGHLYVNLSVGGVRKQCLVHRLVLEAFVGPCPEGMECRHLNGNPADNRLENLRWGTHADNMQDRVVHGTNCRGAAHYKAVLTDEQVREIKRRYKHGVVTQATLAEEFRVSRPHIAQILRGGRRTYVEV